MKNMVGLEENSTKNHKTCNQLLKTDDDETNWMTDTILKMIEKDTYLALCLEKVHEIQSHSSSHNAVGALNK